MTGSRLSEVDERFLVEMFEHCGMESECQVSMYDVGRKLGLDRGVASRIAEDLMGSGLIELRTLAGGVCLSERGRELAQRIAPVKDGEARFKLGSRPIIDESQQEGLETVLAEVKSQAAELALDFDSLNELIVDLKTIAVQLTSPRPKTAIVRACLQSIERILQRGTAPRVLEAVSALLAE